MTEYWNETFDERLEDDYVQGLAVLAGRIDVTGRVSATELENLPRAEYIKVIAEYGSAEQGFGVAIFPGSMPPLSTMSVANEVRAVVEALPGHEFKGALMRQAPPRHGGAFSRISASGRTVRF